MENSIKWIYLKAHKLEMHDSLWNPFEPETEEFEFLTVHNNYRIAEPAEKLLFKLYFEIEPEVQVMQRKRYNFWELLADVGGFFDGVKLLFNFFLTTLSATYFKMAIETGSLEQDAPPNDSVKRKKGKLARKIKNESKQVVIEGEKLGTVTHVYNELKIISDSFWQALFQSLCAKRDKRRRLNYEKHLDVQTLIANSLNLRDFFRSFLTKR